MKGKTMKETGKVVGVRCSCGAELLYCETDSEQSNNGWNARIAKESAEHRKECGGVVAAVNEELSE